MNTTTMNGVDAGELAAMEQELDRKIARCGEDAAAAQKKISTEDRRRARKAEQLEKQERLSFTLHADLVDALQNLDELRATVDSFDVKLLKYQKHTEDKSAALDVLQRLTDLRIKRVRETNDRSRAEAEQWVSEQQENLSKAYDVVGSCVSSAHRWLRVWPMLHLWLSAEHASSQSIHANASSQGLVGELLALCRYASVIKLKQEEKVATELETTSESPSKGVSIKPFTVKARPSMIKEAVNKLRAATAESTAPTEGAIAVKNLIRRVNNQVQDDNTATKAEIETLTDEIKELEEIKRANAALIGELCHAVSADSERCIREVQTEAERTLYDLSYTKDGSSRVDAWSFDAEKSPPKVPVADASPGKKAATPSFEKSTRRRCKKAKKIEEKDVLKHQYEKHGYFPDRKVLMGSDGSKQRDPLAAWLHNFAWKRQLDYSLVHKKLDLTGLLETSGVDATFLNLSSQGRHHSVHLHASGRHSSSHHASKRVAARQQKNSAAEALLRAKLSVVEADKVAATLHASTFDYCEAICKKVELISPLDDIIDMDNEVFSLFGDIGIHGPESDSATQAKAQYSSRRKDGRKMSSIDILSMEGRLMPSVVEEDRECDGDEDADDMVVSRPSHVNDGVDDNEKENGDVTNTPPRGLEAIKFHGHQGGDQSSTEEEIESSGRDFSEHYCGTYPSRIGDPRGLWTATTLGGHQIHGAISDMYQWIKFKEVAIMLAASSSSAHPAAPEYLLDHVNQVIENASASKAVERELRELRKRRATKHIEKMEQRKSVNDHYAKTAGMFLQPDKEGKQKISNHHWNEVSAILDDTAKYKVSGANAAEFDADNNVIAVREQQRMARKTRVNELSKQLRERQFSPPATSRSPGDVSGGQSVATMSQSFVQSIVEEQDEDEEYSDDEQENGFGPVDVLTKTMCGNSGRKVSIVVNEGSRRSFMKGAMVLKVEKKKEVSIESEDASLHSKSDSDSESSDSSDDDDFVVFDNSSSDEDFDPSDKREAQGAALYQRIIKHKPLKFNLFSDILRNKQGMEILAFKSDVAYTSADIKPMFDSSATTRGELDRSLIYPLLLPGRNDYILCEREVLLSPTNVAATVAIVYQPTRDRLVVEAVCKHVMMKFRIPLYQHNIDAIFPTRPSLRIYDFTSHMMNRYLDALIRVLRLDKMLRRDAFALAMNINTGAHGLKPGTGPGQPSSIGPTSVTSARPKTGQDEFQSVSFAPTDYSSHGMFMCSLLPDGRSARMDYVDSLLPQRSLSPPNDVKQRTAPRAVIHFPERVDVNSRPGSHSTRIPTPSEKSPRSASVVSIKPPSPPHGLDAAKGGPSVRPMQDSSSLPEIRKKNSVMTIDVNHGTGIFVPLNRSSSADISPSGDRSSPGLSASRPTPPPPRESSGGLLRPGSGARFTVPSENASMKNEFDNDSMLKLIDATSCLANRLESPHRVPSPRKKITGGTTPRKQRRKLKKKKDDRAPTAGDLARTIHEATLKSTSNNQTPPTILTKKVGYLDTDEYNIDDVVYILNVRKEGNEALLLLGGINCQHDVVWESFM